MPYIVIRERRPEDPPPDPLGFLWRAAGWAAALGILWTAADVAGLL